MLANAVLHLWSQLLLGFLWLLGRRSSLLASGSSELSYMMEDAQESRRLEQKTNLAVTRRQLEWGGLRPGMRALDLGCGMGVVSNLMAEIVGVDGAVLGVDGSAKRIADAERKYLPRENLTFQRCLFEDLGRVSQRFDFVWCRFVLQFLPDPEETLRRAIALLEPNGILCIGELDYNSMSHYPLPARVERCLTRMVALANRRGLDFYMGRRLYTMLCAQGLEDVSVEIEAHHCIYGAPSEADRFNWQKKVEKMARLVPLVDPLYPRGRAGFVDDFMRFFEREDSFSYTPLIKVRGQRVVRVRGAELRSAS